MRADVRRAPSRTAGAAGGAWLAIAWLLAACSAGSGAFTPAAPESGAASGPAESRGFGAISGESTPYRALSVPGFLPAVLYLPPTSRARPLVVANHGAGGVPEAECDYWQRMTRGHAVLLCLRGTPLRNDGPTGYYYKTHLALGSELRAALAALKQAHAARVSPGSGIYAGFSQGAIMGAPVIPEHGDEFPKLALIEGGYEYWSPSLARRFAERGGRRVLFACGTAWCAQKSRIPAGWLQKNGVEVRIEYAEGAGHTAGGEVMERTADALPWLIEGDPNWAE